jgi:chromosome segregation ATPase
MSARANGLKEANQSLTRRLDIATRNADENRVALEEMSKKLERQQKRSHQELEKLDEELVFAKAERDTYRGQAELREVEINRLKKQRGDNNSAKTSDRSHSSPTRTPASKGHKDVGKETGKENVSGRTDRMFTCRCKLCSPLANPLVAC